MKARKLLSKGCEAYLACVIKVKAEKFKPEDVPVVREFLDVFLRSCRGCYPIERWSLLSS